MVNDEQIRPMIQYIKDHTDGPLMGAEIGVWEGSNALSILHNLDIKLLYLVDPWTKHRIYNGRFFGQQAMDHRYKLVLTKTQDYWDRVDIIRKKSVKGSRHVKNNSLDFVYIDGRHKKRFIRQDIQAWMPKVKSGGFLGGHDYCCATPGVITSVDVLVKRYGLELYTKDSDWWIENG